MNTSDEYRRGSKLQRHWAALAFRDAEYVHKRAQYYRKHGSHHLAAIYSQEERFAEWWGERRLALAKKYENISRSH